MNPFVLTGSQILRGIIRDSVGQCGKGCNHKVIELDGCRIARYYRCTEAIDEALDNDVSDRNKALLQDTWNRHRADL